jgi:hypothetical protein
MKPRLKVYHTYQSGLKQDYTMKMEAMQEKYARKFKNEQACHALEWTSNLVMDQEGRAYPCRCGLLYMRRYRTGTHIEPAELIADWQDDERDERPEDADDFMNAPVEVPLKPAVSQAQVLWARDMIAQYPKKSREQISQENGGISWAQLEHCARMPLTGLPERKGAKVAVKPKAPKARAPKSNRKAKGA